jgi:triacylglycerol lipase
LFEAAVADRPGVDYGSVVAGVPPPRERFSARAVLAPERVALRALFRLLHGLASRPHPHYPYPKPSAAVQRRLERGFGFEVTPGTNDGVVPTLSQLHGRLLHVARADHLDVVGHYTLAERTGDWLPSGAGFTPEGFVATWDAVAAAIAGRR